jgi:hypothetical protein
MARSIVGRDDLGQVVDIIVAGNNGAIEASDDVVPHVHDEYAAVHAHPYATDDHTHAAGAEHPDLATHTALGLSATAHDHTGTYSAAAHNHDAAYAATHAHPYAGTAHGHAQTDVTNLTTDLDGKATSAHNHDAAYSGTAHTHAALQDADIPAAIARDAEVTSAIATHAATPHGGESAEAFPVGAVFIAVVNTDPATLLGYGTWSAFGAGRVLIGRDAGDTDFDTAEETGGAKAKAISAHAGATVGNHTFTQPADHSFNEVVSHTHTTDSQGAHVHDEYRNSATTGGLDGWGAGDTSTNTATLTGYDTGSAGGHTHTAAAPAGAVASFTKSHASGAVDAHSVGQASAHTDLNVVQPYIVVYMWKRTA